AQVLKRFFDLEAMLDPRDADSNLLNLFGDISGGQGIVQARAAAVYGEAIAREKATAGALEQVLTGLASVRGRKSVLLVSAGFIYDPRSSRVPELLKACARANAAVYFLDARGSEPPATVGAEGRRTVESRDLSAFMDRFKFDAEGTEAVAADSGGDTLRGNDLAAGLKRVADQSSTYYLLGYQSTNGKRDGTFRRIQVRLRRPGLKLRARSGYFAPSPEPPVLASGSEGPSPEVRAALSLPFGRSEIPLRMSTYELGPREGKVHLALVIEADPGALGSAGKAGPATFDTWLRVSARDSGESWSQEHRLEVALSDGLRSQLASTWLPLQRGIDLPAGTYQARFVWRDVATGRLGSVIHDFRVADPAAFHIAGFILTDLLEPPRPGEAPRPALVARRRFTLGTKLQCQFQVFGAQPDGHGQPQVTAGHVLTRGATVISRLDPTPLPPGAQGQLSRAMVITLRGVPPGAYELAVTARDEVTGRLTEAREAFLVEPPTDGAAASPAGVATTPAGPDSYRGLVQRYQQGQQAEAARELAEWPRARWEEGARALAPGLGCDASCLRGAVLLHTEAAVADRARGQNSAAGAHLGQAHDLLGRIRDDSFRRAWLLAVGYHLQGYVILSPAQHDFEECLKSNPSDAQALLALGTIHELRSVLEGLERRSRGTLAPGGSAGLLPDFLRAAERAAERDREAREAESLYRSALKADSTLVEAHLRLGRVWQRQGREDDARREFTWVLTNRQDHELLFLARLFLGVQEQMAGHGPEARLHFRAAVDLLPHAQSARLALSLAQRATGDPRAAQATARAALRPAAEKETSPDPWVSYHLGLSRFFDAALLDLRARVSP
ncbi:MAG TPA: VWA domain-containing protein, partial [Vicinamibacteria bacterium]|nr:VWA domain-containing protein [Vicinamibacteria bacterium]